MVLTNTILFTTKVMHCACEVDFGVHVHFLCSPAVKVYYNRHMLLYRQSITKLIERKREKNIRKSVDSLCRDGADAQ